MCSASVCDIKSGIDPCPLSYKTNGAYFCLKNQHLPGKQKKKKTRNTKKICKICISNWWKENILVLGKPTYKISSCIYDC